MSRIIFLTLLFSLSSFFLLSQQLELTDKIANDNKVLTGKLDNGLHYYVRSNNIPAKRAEFTLVVKAGSILEDDDQQGLAHFTEHMAFNGTKNFPKNELVNYLESLGMKFGPEVNAYTSFDETVYGIKVPTDSSEYVDKGLLVLFDWASQLTLSTEEINAERGIIHEEWRLGQGANQRIQDKLFKVLFHKSLYAKRLPIGLMEVVDHCDPDVLRRFYNDWYRPDLMAVIVVGDFDAKDMESKVKSLFSTIPPKSNPRPRVYADLPDHDETLVCVASDPELPMCAVQLFYKHPKKTLETVSDYRSYIITQLMSSMISNRLQEMCLQEKPPFLQAGAGYSEFIGPKDVYISLGVVQGNDIKTTLENLVFENERMIKHGFTPTELERVKASFLKEMEKSFNEKDKQKSEKYVNDYKAHFLPPHTPYSSAEYDYELSKKYIPTITLEEVNKFAATMTPNKNNAIVVISPEKEGVVIPSEDDILKIYNNAKQQNVSAYIDKVVDKPLIAKLPPKTKVNKVIKNKELDYETWILKNGIKVVIKTTDFKDDEILFEARSFGGSSLYDTKDDISCRVASDVAEESGLGDFDKTELGKFLSDKNANVSSYIGRSLEGLTGSSSIKDFETLLQMIHISFSKPKTTETAFKSYINRSKSLFENSSLDPQTAMRDTLSYVMGNYHILSRPMSAQLLDEADFKRVKYIYNQRFSDPTNFTFYFVGNIDKKTSKELIEKYLGSLPTIERKENYKDLGIRPPKGAIEKTVYKGKEAKCIEQIVFHGETPINTDTEILIDATCKLLSTRLLEEIREKESGVYSIGAYPYTQAIPYNNYKILIFYSCDPEREPELFDKIFKIIDNLQTTNVSDTEIHKVTEKLRREFETSVKENSFWKNLIIDIEEGRTNNDEYKKYNEIMMKLVTAENLKNSAKQYLNNNNYIKVKLVPENK